MFEKNTEKSNWKTGFGGWLTRGRSGLDQCYKARKVPLKGQYKQSIQKHKPNYSKKWCWVLYKEKTAEKWDYVGAFESLDECQTAIDSGFDRKDVGRNIKTIEDEAMVKENYMTLTEVSLKFAEAGKNMPLDRLRKLAREKVIETHRIGGSRGPHLMEKDYVENLVINLDESAKAKSSKKTSNQTLAHIFKEKVSTLPPGTDARTWREYRSPELVAENNALKDMAMKYLEMRLEALEEKTAICGVCPYSKQLRETGELHISITSGSPIRNTSEDAQDAQEDGEA